MFIKYLSSSCIRSDHFLFFLQNLHSLLPMSIYFIILFLSFTACSDWFLWFPWLIIKLSYYENHILTVITEQASSWLLIFYLIYPTCFLLLPIFQSRMWNLYSQLQIVCLTSLTSPISVVQMSIQMSFIFPPLNQHKNQTFLWSICWRVRYRHLFTDILYRHKTNLHFSFFPCDEVTTPL